MARFCGGIQAWQMRDLTPWEHDDYVATTKHFTEHPPMSL